MEMFFLFSFLSCVVCRVSCVLCTVCATVENGWWFDCVYTYVSLIPFSGWDVYSNGWMNQRTSEREGERENSRTTERNRTCVCTYVCSHQMKRAFHFYCQRWELFVCILNQLESSKISGIEVRCASSHTLSRTQGKCEYKILNFISIFTRISNGKPNRNRCINTSWKSINDSMIKFAIRKKVVHKIGNTVSNRLSDCAFSHCLLRLFRLRLRCDKE